MAGDICQLANQMRASALASGGRKFTGLGGSDSPRSYHARIASAVAANID